MTRHARGARRNATREFNEQFSVLAQLDRWLASWTGVNQSRRVEEHYRFEVARKKDGGKSSLVGDFGNGVEGYGELM